MHVTLQCTVTNHLYTIYQLINHHTGQLSFRSYPDQIQNNPINVRLQKVLESGNDGGIEAVRKAMDFYQACMNTAVINALGNEPLYDLVRQTGITVS